MKIAKKGRQCVFGIFNDQQSLNKAIELLKSQNFRSSDISVLVPSTKDFAFEKTSKAPEGATTGAAAGAIGGSVFGWLVGAGALAIPGLGPFIAAGPIMAAIAGAGIGGTVGGVAGGLIGLGIPEIEAHKYAGLVKEGGLLISIHVDNDRWEDKAKEILEENGAVDVATTSEKKSKTTLHYQSRIDRDFDDMSDSFRL